MSYILLNADRCARSALDGAGLFFNSVFPTLFPFFVLSSFAADAGLGILKKPLSPVTKLLKIQSGKYIYPISVLSGYPTSAKIISEGYLDGKITKKDAGILSVLCANASPAFIISFIGSGLYHNPKVSLILIIANYLSQIISAYILSLSYPGEHSSVCSHTPHPEKISAGYISSFVRSVQGSIAGIINVGAFIVFFSVIRDIAKTFAGENIFLNIIFSSLELSGGCSDIAAMPLPITLKMAITGFVVCFGGLCVLFQSLSFMDQCDMDKKIFVEYKIFSGITGAVISFFLSTVFISKDVQAFMPMDKDINMAYGELNILLLCLLITIILYAIIYNTTDKGFNEHKRNFKTGGKRS